MQTSFMHPPFGFALFYLRSVAPTKEYTDRVTQKTIPPVTTMQIYWGAVPFVVIQLIMVGLIIAFPGIVSSGLDKKVTYDLDQVRTQMEQTMMPEPPPAEPEADPNAAPGAEPTAETPAADAESGTADDPMKAMQESMAGEKKK
jgi:hypothetical protein